MSSEIVKYGNQLNSVPFKNFNRKDLNIFFSIISRLRDKGSKKVTFSYNQLMALSNIHYHNHLSYFTHDLNKTYSKLIHVTYYKNTPKYFKKGVLFDTFYIDKERHTCTIKVNPEFTGVLNHLANWTRFSLEQFTSLRSSYSKNCFRLIKQWRTFGRMYLPIKKFRELLAIPKSYSNTQITQRVIKPIIVELTPLVRGLHVMKITHGRGGRIIGYRFEFTPELHKQDDFSKGKIKDKETMLKYVKYNDFIPPKLKAESIHRIEKYQDPITVHSNKAKKHTYSMKMFNHMLKHSGLQELRYYLALHDSHSKLVHFSEYQVRKLKKTIIAKHNKKVASSYQGFPKSKALKDNSSAQVASERQLNKMFGVKTNNTKKH